MTREEAIKIASETYGWLKTDREREAFETLIPELKESKDERIRKELIEFIKWSVDRHFMREDFHQAKRPSEWIAYLEKQKEQKPMDKIDLKFNIGDTIVNKKNGEKCTISNRCLLHQYYSDTNHCHEIKFDEQDDWELVEQKEQDKCPEYCVRSHCIGCSIYEKQKEKWPILDVFGFKVGDAVRLKDGDGRKHIIKSFEEVEGVHGPNFYHVEFEDNSARDGIYPGEEYPNGYYTQMEKFEEEQKPAEWSEEDSDNLERVDNYLWMLDSYVGDDCAMPQGKTDKIRENIQEILSPWVKSLPERFNLQPKQEWSEEDEKMLKSITGDLFCGTDFNMELKFAASKKVNWLKDKLKSLRPNKQD